MSNSLRPHGQYSPWNSPGQNTGVGSLSLFQGFKIEVFLPFGFFLPKFGPVACVSLVDGEICVGFLFVCFSSDGQG